MAGSNGRSASGGGGTPSRSRRSSSPTAERNRQIAEARAAGVSVADCAARFGLSQRRVRSAEKEHIRYVAESGALDGIDAGAVLRETIEAHRWAIDELEAAARDADSTSAKVGAIRSRVATSRDLLALLATAGLIAASPDEWIFERDAFAAATAMLDEAAAVGLDRAAVLDRLRPRVRHPLVFGRAAA